MTALKEILHLLNDVPDCLKGLKQKWKGGGGSAAITKD